MPGQLQVSGAASIHLSLAWAVQPAAHDGVQQPLPVSGAETPSVDVSARTGVGRPGSETAHSVTGRSQTGIGAGTLREKTARGTWGRLASRTLVKHCRVDEVGTGWNNLH